MKRPLYDLNLYDFSLPGELIAQQAAQPRDSARLLVIDRQNRDFQDRHFGDIAGLIGPGDVLVLNDTRVINARLRARRKSGAALEILLLSEQAPGVWRALVNPAQRARVGETIEIGHGYCARILDRTPDGGRILEFSPGDIKAFIAVAGEVPLPPYIKDACHPPGRYQTVYAKKEGAIAAPTAGLHFTPALLRRIEDRGVKTAQLTLHCGLATFRPVKTADVREHPMSQEWVEITPAAADTINKARAGGGRIIAVGTTSLRALESAATPEGVVEPFCGETGIYIFPGYRFKATDGLVTNFHVPCSTNLILACTFGGYERVMRAYRHAIGQKYRFFSFGDATIIL